MNEERDKAVKCTAGTVKDILRADDVRVTDAKIFIHEEAEAEAMILAAEAEAEGNRLLAESITPELLEWQKYQKWNGKLPEVTGASSTIVDMTN